jgi:predicted GH43/DUF377 family glycosyl hydrolase
MVWQKLKHIFQPHNHFGWMQTHAANPFAVKLNKDIFRIYFTCRNAVNQSHIGFVDVNAAKDFEIISVSEKPVLAPGEPGMFDDSGVAMGYYIQINKVPHIYYLGWNLKVTVPWLNTIGLAKFDKELNQFVKVSRAPVLDRSNEDPYSISYPSILFENRFYKMWYGSNLSWGKEQHQMKHIIKYAESNDGIHWKRFNNIALNLEHPGEYALSKPFVIEKNGKYKMWYSYRANGKILTYRIGYAESNDGKHWERKDEQVGIDTSSEGWDSEMICYPFIFDYKRKRYMLYNGNGYGRSGFGIAVLL